MTRLPRILPLIGIAIAGVLAINALAGARSLPDLINGAKAFAEGVAKVATPKAAAAKAKPAKAGDTPEKPFAASPLPPDSPNSPDTAVATAATPPAADVASNSVRRPLSIFCSTLMTLFPERKTKDRIQKTFGLYRSRCSRESAKSENPVRARLCKPSPCCRNG